MANGLPNFVKEEEQKLIFSQKDHELIFYVPEKYFERNICEESGELFTLLGVFDYTVQDINTGKNIGLHNFMFPSYFQSIPGSTEKQKNIQLTKYSSPEAYRILRYREGDTVICSTIITQFIGNVEKLNNLFYILGYIPNTIPYDKVYQYIIDGMNLNGEAYEVNNQMIGITLGEVCRDIDNDNIPYRLSGKTDPHAYKSMSVKNISKLTSPYTALISEDFDESVLYAMMNDSPKDTPLEQVLVGEN